MSKIYIYNMFSFHLPSSILLVISRVNCHLDDDNDNDNDNDDNDNDKDNDKDSNNNNNNNCV